jgi:hypothetical protein
VWRTTLRERRACGRTVDSQEALLFEQRSKNFCLFGARVEAMLTPYKQKFFGSFSQKRTACSPASAAPGKNPP